MNTFNLTLDLNKSRASSPVRLRQGDAQGTTITALVLDHGATADLTGMTAQLVMELPDGTQYYRKNASISGNSVSVLVDETQAASVSGRTANAYFQMLQGTTVKASTGSFAVEILPDALEGHTVPESYDSAIQDAIDALDDAVADMPDMVEDVLADHPEWTTTVQDGSITKAKLATDLAQERERLMYRLDNLLTNALPEGETATATDAAQTPVAGLALYGRSTQDGTPTPSAPVAIQSVGTANLLDDGDVSAATSRGITVTPESDGWFRVSGTSTGTNAGVMTLWEASDLDMPAGAYTAVMETEGTPFAENRLRMQVYGGSVLAYITNAGSYAFNATAGITRVGIHFASNSEGTVLDGRFRLAIYAGSTAYPYVPYGSVGLWSKRTSDATQQSVTPIPLQGHELRSLPDGTRDELRVDERGHAVLVQRVGSVDLGTLTWTPISSSDTSKKRMDSSGVRSSISPTPSGVVPNVMCERYQPKKNNDVYQLVTGVNIASDGDIVIYDPDYNTNDSASAFAAAVSGVALIYPLATPVTHDLGIIDAVPLVGPDLTAQAVPTAPFALTYERDLNTTLARLESAIANLV